MRTRCIILFIGLVIMTSIGCGQNKSDFMKKSDSDKARLEERANNGDGTAAYELFVTYAFGDQNLEKAEFWIKRAADLGEPRACEDFAKRKKKEELMPVACSGKTKAR